MARLRFVMRLRADVAVIAASLAWGALVIYNKGVAAEKLREVRESVKLAQTKVDSLMKVVAARDQHWKRGIDSLTLLARKARISATSHGKIADSIVTQVVKDTAVAAELRARIELIVEEFHAQRDSLESAIKASEGKEIAYEARLADKDLLILRLQAQVKDLTTKLDIALKRASPAWYVTALKAAPFVGGALATGYVIGALGGH